MDDDLRPILRAVDDLHVVGRTLQARRDDHRADRAVVARDGREALEDLQSLQTIDAVRQVSALVPRLNETAPMGLKP